MRKLRLSALLVAFCLFAETGWTSTVIYRTDAELVALSERVVHGRVIGQRTTRGGPTGRTIYTVTTLQIIEDFTGIDGATVEVWELGGRIDDEELYVGGQVRFNVGQEVVVCLERGPRGLRTVAMGFSTFDVVSEGNGEHRLRRNLRDTAVVGGRVVREPLLSEIRALAVRATGRPSRSRRQPIVAADVSSVSQPYTFLGPFRWTQADSGIPVTWYVNTTAPSPLTSGNIATEMQTALSAWTSPPSASIILTYGGTTFQSDVDGPFSGLASAAGVVTFEDPRNEINGSVLAIGGGWAGGNGGTINGVSFAAFSRGYVIFQNAADLGSFRQPPNFTRVLIHEIGHAIGLGHSDSTSANIMYPSCCHAGTPTPPAIGPDDLAGLNFIYPSSSPTPSCTFSINPTTTSAGAGSSTGSVAVTTQTGCSWNAVSNASFVSISSGSAGTGSGSVGYTVTANAATSPRTGTITIAGHTFSVNQAGACAYTLTPASTAAAAAGGSASLTVSTTAGCAWTAASNSPFLSVTSGSTGSGNGTVAFSIAANGVNFRTGTMTVAGQTFSVYQFGTGPMVSIDRPSLRYGATISGGTVTAQTSSQVLRLTQSAGTAVSWTATSNQPWLTVSPASGTGVRELTVTVNPSGLTPGIVSGAITIALTGAGNIVSPISVSLATMSTGGSAIPSGVIDTPLENATGVTGAIPVTGWAVDDVDVESVFVCRDPVSGETAGVDARCGSTARLFLGEAVFIEDARPDIASAFPTVPRSYRGGWGLMVLTNMLPSQGNGTYTLHAYARDREGHVLSIGSRTLTCDNANATRPFGTIDTPIQGGTASGSSYLNFGWALTPLPKFIPTDGSTITVFVDGVSQGGATYNNTRSDISSLFPGLNNTNGAIGFRHLDTTTLADGLHTIAWTVTDNLGATEGIGSRYFRVTNGTAGLTSAPGAAALTMSSAALAAGSGEAMTIAGRLGWDPATPWRTFGVDSAGRSLVRSEEISRIELRLGGGSHGQLEGYLRVGSALAALPVGSKLNTATGVFTWQPGVGYVGRYDLLFVRREGDRINQQQDVRVVLSAKGSGFVGPQVVIDTPTPQVDLAQPFVVAGWAVDPRAVEGTGVETVHVWAYPLTGGPPIFLGAAVYGGTRPDVAAVHGDQFRDAGFGLGVQGLPHGHYDLAVFAWSSELGDFAPAKTVRVTVR